MRLPFRRSAQSAPPEESKTVTLVVDHWGYDFKEHEEAARFNGNWKISLTLTISGVGSVECYCEYIRQPLRRNPPTITWIKVRSESAPDWHDEIFEHNYFPTAAFALLFQLSTLTDVLSAGVLASSIEQELAWVPLAIHRAVLEQPFTLRDETPAWDLFRVKAEQSETALNLLLKEWLV